MLIFFFAIKNIKFSCLSYKKFYCKLHQSSSKARQIVWHFYATLVGMFETQDTIVTERKEKNKQKNKLFSILDKHFSI